MRASAALHEATLFLTLSSPKSEAKKLHLRMAGRRDKYTRGDGEVKRLTKICMKDCAKRIQISYLGSERPSPLDPIFTHCHISYNDYIKLSPPPPLGESALTSTPSQGERMQGVGRGGEGRKEE